LRFATVGFHKIRGQQMLDAFIIEELIRREQKQPQDRAVLEIPKDQPTSTEDEDEADESERGVVIIDMNS